MRRNDNNYATKLWTLSLRKHKVALVKTCDGKQIIWRRETRIHWLYTKTLVFEFWMII